MANNVKQALVNLKSRADPVLPWRTAKLMTQSLGAFAGEVAAERQSVRTGFAGPNQPCEAFATRLLVLFAVPLLAQADISPPATSVCRLLQI